MISNSFHSSTKSHSIANAGALRQRERHNDRGYFSFVYDRSKIDQLVGDSATIAADVEQAINTIFNPYVEEYNERQRRKDRKIQTSAFEYFCSQKKLDIAVEAIFQVGDMQFWEPYRTDTVVRRGKKNVVHHRFDPKVQAVMADIYRKQIDAFEKIYETHGEQIAAAIRSAYDGAFAVVQSYERQQPSFQEIYKIPSRERVAAIDNLTLPEQIAYTEYAQARDTMAAIVRHNLLDRAENGNMHIKIISGTQHADEWSLHAHAIALCWSEGYKNGLSARVSKTVVLNKWALEIIQDRMHEIAEQEIAKHPEFFGKERIKPKEVGRNYDYTTEQIRRHNLAKLQELTDNAREEAREASQKARTASLSALEAEDRLKALKAEEERLEANIEPLVGYEQYSRAVKTTDTLLDDIIQFFDWVQDRAQELFQIPDDGFDFIESCRDIVIELYNRVMASFQRILKYERDEDPPVKLSRSLDDKIEEARSRVEDLPNIGEWRPFS